MTGANHLDEVDHLARLSEALDQVVCLMNGVNDPDVWMAVSDEAMILQREWDDEDIEQEWADCRLSDREIVGRPKVSIVAGPAALAIEAIHNAGAALKYITNERLRVMAGLKIVDCGVFLVSRSDGGMRLG